MRWLLAAVVVMVGVGVEGHWSMDPPPRQDRTPPTRCIPPNPCFPSRQVIAELDANLTGSVYQPSDAEYVSVVTSDNRRLIRHPAIVVMAATEMDVQKAVLFARKFHLMLTVTAANGDTSRGSYGDASLQINLSNLNTITANVDQGASPADPGTVVAGPGATWAQLIQTASNNGRAVSGQGYWGDLPIGEQTQAGGYGPLSRSLGLFADNLLSARMVTMGGSVIELSDAGATITTVDGVSRFTTLDPGLWGALRGAGAANFGIVTSYTFLMHVPPPYVTQVTASYVLYENEQFVGREPLKFLLPKIYSLPSEWGGLVYLNGKSSDTTVGQKGTLTLELVHYGAYNSASYLAAQDILSYDANGARLTISIANRTTMADADRSISVQWPQAGVRGYGFNTLLPPTAFTDADTLDDLVDSLLLILNDPAVNAHYACALQPLGGAISTINSTAYVTAALRQAAMAVDCALTWEESDAIRDDQFLHYAIGFGKRIKHFGSGISMGLGLFEDEEDWKHALYGGRYKELMRVKSKYDVDNYLWCHNCVASDYTLNCGRRGCDKHREERRGKELDRMSEENDRRIMQFVMGDRH